MLIFKKLININVSFVKVLPRSSQSRKTLQAQMVNLANGQSRTHNRFKGFIFLGPFTKSSPDFDQMRSEWILCWTVWRSVRIQTFFKSVSKSLVAIRTATLINQKNRSSCFQLGVPFYNSRTGRRIIDVKKSPNFSLSYLTAALEETFGILKYLMPNNLHIVIPIKLHQWNSYFVFLLVSYITQRGKQIILNFISR